MKKSTLLIFLAPITLFLAIPFSLVNAQGPTELSSLTIKLWPEYDDPRLLVIIDGELATPGSEIRIPIPAEAELNAVASANSSGRLLRNDWREEKTEDGGRLLVMTPENPVFRVEYYTPILTNGDQRTIQFELPAGYLNTKFGVIEILLPPDSSDITLSPSADEPSQTEDTAHLFQRTLGEVKAVPIVQEVIYNNPNNTLTAPRPTPTKPISEPKPSAQPPSTPPVSKSSLNPWILILGAAALLLIVGGVVGLWLTRDNGEEETPPIPPRAKSKRKKSHIVSASSSKNLDRFCRQCGREFGPDDRFCRYCGTPRQTL